jgi:hypothetical protein
MTAVRCPHCGGRRAPRKRLNGSNSGRRVAADENGSSAQVSRQYLRLFFQPAGLGSYLPRLRWAKRALSIRTRQRVRCLQSRKPSYACDTPLVGDSKPEPSILVSSDPCYFVWDPKNGSNLRCPLLALSGHRRGLGECLLSGVKRTSLTHPLMSAFDPKRTSSLLKRISPLAFKDDLAASIGPGIRSAPCRPHAGDQRILTLKRVPLCQQDNAATGALPICLRDHR